MQLVVVVAVAWSAGGFLAERAFGKGTLAVSCVTERAVIAIVGFVALCVTLMAVHIVTRGQVFGRVGVVPAVGAVVLISGWRRGVRPPSISWRRAAAAAAVLVALYAGPVIAGGSSLRTGDTPWHMGRTNHLLGGKPVPGGPAARYDRNAYPWGFHAVLATVVRLIPGSDLPAAYTCLHILVMFSLPVVAAALAGLVEPRAAWPAAGCASLLGGFGWAAARSPFFATSPEDARYGADLVIGSPNALYALFPPALPREIGLVLLGASAVLIVRAASRPGASPAVLAGAAVGITGLMSVPMLLNAGAWTVAILLVSRADRATTLVRLVVPATAVFALWGLPVAVDYFRFGGFVNVSPKLGREWGLGTAIASWGLLAPLACAGVVVALRAYRDAVRPLLAVGVAVVAMMALAVARGVFDWELGGVPWLLHQGRMWPPAHLLAAAFAGLALYRAYAWLRPRRHRLAAAGVGVALGVGALSPALASVALAAIIGGHRGGYIYADDDFAPGSFIDRAASRLGPEDTVRTQGSPTLDLFLFQYAGARIANFDDERLPANDVRIRYAELAHRWNERAAAGAFDDDYMAMPAQRAPPGAPAVATGPYDGRWYVLIRSRRADQRGAPAADAGALFSRTGDMDLRLGSPRGTLPGAPQQLQIARIPGRGT